jgi:hypothetical protein
MTIAVARRRIKKDSKPKMMKFKGNRIRKNPTLAFNIPITSATHIAVP